MSESFGQYRLLEELGRGSMGDAWLARDPGGELVVIKRLHPELSEDGEFIERFAHEAELARRISSPFVARVLDSGQAGSHLFIAFELVEGWTLSKVLAFLRRRGPKFPSVAATAAFVADLLRGVEAIHELCDDSGARIGALHRDLSPRNVMFTESDGRPKIIDLGLGSSRLQSWKTKTGAVFGSPGYMSPEQARGEKLDERADLYSVGVLFWELLTLESFFGRGSVPELLLRSQLSTYRSATALRSEVGHELDELVRKALAPAREDRFSRAAEFREAIGALRLERAGLDLFDIVGEIMTEEMARTRVERTRVFGADHAIGATEERALSEPTFLADSQQPDTQQPTLTLATPDEPRGSRPWVWGAAVAALVGGGALAVVPRYRPTLPAPDAGVEAIGAVVPPAIQATPPQNATHSGARALFEQCARTPDAPVCQRALEVITSESESESESPTERTREPRPRRPEGDEKIRRAEPKAPKADGAGTAKPKTEDTPDAPVQTATPVPPVENLDLGALRDRAKRAFERLRQAEGVVDPAELARLKSLALDQTIRPDGERLRALEEKMRALGVP